MTSETGMPSGPIYYAGGFGSAAAIVELKEDVELTVGGGRDGLLSGKIAH